MNQATVDSSRCPLCLHPNECGLVDGIGTCWCFESSVLPQALNQGPHEATDCACLCRICLSGKQRNSTVALEAIRDSIRTWR